MLHQGERGPIGPAMVGPRGIPGIPGERGEPVSILSLAAEVCLVLQNIGFFSEILHFFYLFIALTNSFEGIWTKKLII